MFFSKQPKNFNPKFEVVSCFCEHKGEILLLERQINKPQGGTWGVPAGKIDPGENITEALIREVWEETGIKLDKTGVSFYRKFYDKYADFDFVYHIFYTNFKDRPEIKIRNKEHSKYVWVSPQKALEMNLIEDLDGYIRLYYKL